MDLKEHCPEATRRPTASSASTVPGHDFPVPSASALKKEGTRGTQIPPPGDDSKGCKELPDEKRGRSVEGHPGWNHKTAKSSKCINAGAVAVVVAIARLKQGKMHLTGTSRRAANDKLDKDVSDQKEGGDSGGGSI